MPGAARSPLQLPLVADKPNRLHGAIEPRGEGGDPERIGNISRPAAGRASAPTTWLAALQFTTAVRASWVRETCPHSTPNSKPNKKATGFGPLSRLPV